MFHLQFPTNYRISIVQFFFKRRDSTLLNLDQLQNNKTGRSI